VGHARDLVERKIQVLPDAAEARVADDHVERQVAGGLEELRGAARLAQVDGDEQRFVEWFGLAAGQHQRIALALQLVRQG